MSNKMLIDASHPEETRVAVVRGNRVEEFDFESQEKKQLRGNIYLAKVARVEPSLQAAFVDYGGNRHGFLAFSEIHPDYYQIPVADRQALLEAEAAEARASREAEELEDEGGEAADEQPKKKPRRRRSRKSKAAAEENTSETNDEVDTASEDETANTVEAENADASDAATSDAEVEPTEEAEAKPKRRSTRRKKAPAKKAETDETSETDTPSEKEVEASEEEVEEKPKRRSTRRKKAPAKKAEADESTDDDGEDGEPKTIAAMVEMDEISEDLPETGSGEEEATEASTEQAEETVAEEKPKRRSTRRKKATPKKEETEAEATKEDATSEDAPAEDAEAEDAASEEAAKETKPKRKSTRRTRKKKTDDVDQVEAKEADAETSDDANETEEASVESVGQEDALEEVPQPKRLRRHYKIQEVIKRRQVLLVQVVKEERGNKGAALTTYLSLAGRYSVLMPNTARGGGISRKITNSADRKRLKAIASELDVPQGMGVILRTAGASRTNEEITRDFEYLMRLWEQVRNLTLSSSAPCLVYEEGSLIKRSIRDLYDKNTGEVLVAGEDGFNEAKDFMTMLMPNAAKKVKLHRDKQTIFARYGVETQLDKMVTPQVTLKSGGYLIIDQTEALVAVDVNSGRSTREHSVEDTALQTNLEAAEEVARQLRLRDLAGLIVIDFIDMEEKRNIRAVEKRLKDCLKNDRARIQVGRISHFGLMEMSRQRMRASVLESTMDVCSACGGTGHVRSESAIALHVFRAIEEHVSRHNKYDAVIKSTPAIALNLLNFKRAALLELEERFGLQIIVETSDQIKGQDFDIEKGDLATGQPKSEAVGMQNEAAFEALDEGDGEKPERGRGRKRNKRDDADEADENTSETSVEGSDDDGEKPKRKRRRGKRGGRNRRSAEDANADSETSEASAKSTDEPVEATADTDLPSETEAEEKPKSRSTRRKKAPVVDTDTSEVAAEENAEEKPKPRSTRRKKAPVSEPTGDNTETETANATAEPETSETEEKPKRRTTRRKKAPEPEVDTPVEAANAEVNETPTAETEGEENTENGSEKKSWWNRGGGLF